jgi:uncharacterized protein (DUF433 family)
MNLELLKRITYNPKQFGGRPCIRGLRFKVTDVLELLAYGMTTEQILEEHPSLEADDIKASLLYATVKMDYPVLIAA